jgi:predicted secreted protein
MTYDERTVVQRDETDAAPATVPTAERSTAVTSRTVEMRPSGGTVASRIVVFIFGVIQAFIVLRIILLLMDAREGNDLVSFILNTSQIFVGPFEGILRTEALTKAGSIFDLTAVLALVGWTILEAIILAGVRVFRREPA